MGEKLFNLMGTRFMIGCLNSSLEKCFKEHEGETIDLAGCRFEPTCAGTLNRYLSKINFINSDPKEVVENLVLKSNYKALEEHKEVYPEFTIPEQLTLETFCNKIKEVPKGSKWHVGQCFNNVNSFGAAVAFVVLFVGMRYDCEWDLSYGYNIMFGLGKVGSLFNIDMYSKWTGQANKHNSYIYNSDGIPTIVNVSHDKVTINFTEYELPIAIQKFRLLPAEYGSVQTAFPNEDLYFYGEFGNIYNYCMSLLQADTDNSSRKLSTLLRRRE